MRTSKYSKEFKDSTIQLILNNNENVSKIATDLDIHVKTLYNWISTYKKVYEFKLPLHSKQGAYDRHITTEDS